MIEPQMPSKGMNVLTWSMAVWKYLRAIRPKAGPGITFTESPSGTIISLARSKRGGVGGETAPCAFGQIYTDGEDKKIRGGLLVCGDKNFNVEGQVLTLGTDGVWLVQILLDSIECATDDDDEIFLPGIITSAGTPAWDNKAWTDPTDYDDTTNPSDPTDTGTIVVPIGKLTIADGVASLSATGCGNITVSQCAGLLNFTRG